MAMIEVGGLGMIRNIWFKKKNIQDARRATILISNYHAIMWVWIGMNVTSNTKKAVTAKAEEIKIGGYQLEGETLGGNIQQVIILDEYSMKSAGNQETAQHHQQLLATLDSLQINPHGTSNYIVEVNAPGPQVSQAVPTATGRDPRNDSLVGIMLISLLEEYPESFVSRKTDGSVQIETASGETISFNFVNFQLQVQSNSKPIPNTVMEKYNQLTKPA